MENQAAETQNYEDVQKSGYLRKHKSMHRRFFVLRAASEHGPARLEYYENEKKFRSKSPVPKKVLNLETCFNINKRADSKNKHMIVLYTRSESFAIAADSEEIQNEWYQAMQDLQCNCKTPEDYGSSGECSSPSPVPTFKEVWQVKVWPKGLGHARNLVGIYRLCLTEKTVNFVKLNSDVAAVVLQLMNVRRCGHSENFFFIEVGRSAITGPGEFWMQVDDSVVAQNMHETLLEAMKALSEEFRQRSKSQSVGTSCGGGTASNPISVPSRRHHPNLPPSQVGFSRRARTETPGTGGSSTSTSPTSRHGFPRARTASIGARSEEGGGSVKGTWASSSPSLNGSCSTTPTLRPKPTRAPTPAKITLSLARYTPNPAPSPAPSLSSSSGHGSECGLVGAAVGGMTICSYPRVSQRVSVSGSPSDYGSSDEYGSSPGEHSLLVPSLSGHHVHGEGSSSYIVMGQREGLLGSHHRSKGRRILRRASSRETEAERRLLSKRASLPLAAHERLTPHTKDEDDEDDEEYAIMSQTGSRERADVHRGSRALAVGGVQLEDGRKRGDKSRGEMDTGAAVDSGYMAMLPGVTSPVPLSLSIGMPDTGTKPGTDDEYMAMTPNNSVSPPQHIHQPSTEGYMVMSPNSTSSTELHRLGMWDSRTSMESRTASDYMNISPVCSRSACSTPPSHPEQHQLQPKMFNSYFSLPRAYQHTLYNRFEDDLNKKEGKKDSSRQDSAGRGGGVGYSKRNKITVGSVGGCQLSMSSSSFSSSSASSESLEDKSISAGKGLSLLRTGTEYKSAGTCTKEGHHHPKHGSSGKSPKQQRRGRPLSVIADITKANTLPRVKESLLPSVSQNVGEYVSIVFKEDSKYDGGQCVGTKHAMIHGTLRPINQPLFCHNNPKNLPRSFSAPLSTSAEYVSMDLGKTSTALTAVGSTFNSPRSPPAVALKSRHERSTSSLAAEGNAGYRTKGKVAAMPTTAPAPFTDNKGSDSSISGMPVIHSVQPVSMEQESASGFSPAKSFHSPERGSRSVRGDSQGRQSHRTEAFNSPPSLPHHPPASTSIFQEGSQAASHRHGLDCSLWENRQTSSLSATTTPQASAEQGLNYIDLDLAVKESPQAGAEHTPTTYNITGNALGSSASSTLNTYASIDFYKSEELRAHQSSRKDGQGNGPVAGSAPSYSGLGADARRIRRADATTNKTPDTDDDELIDDELIQTIRVSHGKQVLGNGPDVEQHKNPYDEYKIKDRDVARYGATGPHPEARPGLGLVCEGLVAVSLPTGPGLWALWTEVVGPTSVGFTTCRGNHKGRVQCGLGERQRAGVGLLVAPQLSHRMLEFTPLNERVASLRLRVGDRCLTVISAYGPNGSAEYLAFLVSLGGVLNSATLTWAMTDTLGRRSMIDLVVVSSDLRPRVFDTRVKRGAVLSSTWWRGKWCTVNIVYSRGAELLTKDIVGRWKKYFEDLLNPAAMSYTEEAEAEVSEVDSSITQAEVTEVVVKLLGGKAPGVDEIRPEYLKSLDVQGLSCLTRLCDIAWQYLWIVRPGRWSLFSKRVTGGHLIVSLVVSCGGVLRQYGVRGPLLRAVWSLYDQSQSLVHIAGSKSDLFQVHVGLQQGCPPSPVLFITFMDRISRHSQGPEGVRFGDHRISSLLFEDDVVLLASLNLDLQRALERFAAECDASGMRISTSKSEAMVLDRKRVVCPL
ncbi:insulin receptor substrate 1-B [Antennarius striatus]|uniref:insulin receptor substrate 1-B n=1 Tax=Antennarius striatus TaxID=241820 RepID=UPI0035B49F8F